MTGVELPEEIERNGELMQQLEALRQAAAVAMGIAPDLAAAKRMVSIPKVALLSAPKDNPTLSGRTVAAADMDILTRMISVGQPHRATPLTGALCLAVGCRVPGSIAHGLARPSAPAAPIRIGHPSGTITVAAEVQADNEGVRVPYATVFRTARLLFRGEVLYREAAAS